MDMYRVDDWGNMFVSVSAGNYLVTRGLDVLRLSDDCFKGMCPLRERGGGYLDDLICCTGKR